MNKLTLVAALAAFIFSAPALTQSGAQLPPEWTPATQPEEAAALEWLKASGKAFDPSAYGEADLAPLVDRLGTARIVGIGEATHGAHQDQAFKAELIKALVKAGKIQVLVLEANRDAGRRIDRFVRLGEGDAAEVIRSGSFFRIWKNDEFAGLVLWLRAWNLQSAQKVRVIGIDNQDAGRDNAFALDFIARFDPAAARRLRAGLGSLMPAPGKEHGRFITWYIKAPRTEVDRAVSTTTALRAWFENAPAKARADAGFADARWAAETARQAFNIYEYERADADKSKADIAYYMRRDRFMAENVVGMLGADEHAAIWAHNDHIREDLPKMAKDMGVVLLGTAIRDRLGDGYATVGFTWSQGSFNAARLSDNTPSTDEMAGQQKLEALSLPNNRPGEIGHLFDQTGKQAMWIDIATRPRGALIDSWAKRPYWFGSAGWGLAVEKWQIPDPAMDIPVDAVTGFDVLVWFRTISPSRLWMLK